MNLEELGIDESKEYSLAEIENIFLENRDVYLCGEIELQPRCQLQIYHSEESGDDNECEVLFIIGDDGEDNQIVFHSGETINAEGETFEGCTFDGIIDAFKLDKSERIWSVLPDSRIGIDEEDDTES